MNRGIELTERITTDIEGFSEEKSQKKARFLQQKEMLAFSEVITPPERPLASAIGI